MSEQQPYWQQQPPPYWPPPPRPIFVPATFGARFVAYLIDTLLMMVPMLGVIPIIMIFALLGDVVAILAALFGGVVMLAAFAHFLWNYCYRQGVTGQTIGKQYQGIAVVREADIRPVGAGMSFARYLLASAISQVTCGIYGLVDAFWVLVDPDRQRLTDKILKFHVIVVDQSVPVSLRSFNPFTPLADQTPGAFGAAPDAPGRA